ncbi:MAG: hypothetical protein AAF512_00475 [Pseudomonadota bacterium]
MFQKADLIFQTLGIFVEAELNLMLKVLNPITLFEKLSSGIVPQSEHSLLTNAGVAEIFGPGHLAMKLLRV